MTAEQAWHVLRTAAGVELGDPHYYSAPVLLQRAYTSTSRPVGGVLTVECAARVLELELIS